MLPPSEVELDETTRRVLEAIQRSAPRRMVFDSLSELRLLAQGPLRYRRQILALKQFFVGRQCTVIMIDDRTSEGPDLQLHSIAHGVIALNSSAPAYGQIRRELQVIKFRGSDFISGFHDFAIRRGGLTVYPRWSSCGPQLIVREGNPSERCRDPRCAHGWQYRPWNQYVAHRSARVRQNQPSPCSTPRRRPRAASMRQRLCLMKRNPLCWHDRLA